MNTGNKLQTALEHFQHGRLDQAELECKEILKVQPDDSDSLHLLGVICYQRRDLEPAMDYINRSLEINPDNASACYNLGAIYRDKELIDKSIDCYRKSLSLDPSNAAAYNNLSISLKEKGLLDEAVSCCLKAIELDPDMITAYYILGAICQQKGLTDEAVSYYSKAVELDSQNPALRNSLGLVLKEKGHLDKALTHFEKSFTIEPNDTALNQIFEISYLILRGGDLQKGWRLYWRFNDSYWQKQITAKPIWNGEDINGLTIVLQSDAGFGDAVQYVRYASMVAERGAKVILNCQKEIISLLKSVKGLNNATTDIPLSQFDIFIPLRRLPLVFGTTLETIPSDIPYIRADVESVRKWKDRLLHKNAGLKVGIVWEAGHGDRNRSCTPDTFSYLLEIQGIVFCSLQVGLDASEILSAPEGSQLFDYTKEIRDFSDTAALIENLDLVISVDTAVAHVAGALGKPVWTLLPFIIDSRWLLDREDSPWYPTMRLFRQPSPGDWESVIRKVFEELSRK